MLVTKLKKLSSKYKRKGRVKAASLLEQATQEIKRLLAVEQTAGDLCKDCGWAGIRPPDSCAFCRMSKDLKSDIDGSTYQRGYDAGVASAEAITQVLADQRDALQRNLWEQGERLKEAVATEQRLLSMLGTLMKSAERVGNERDAAEARALALALRQVVAQAEVIRQQAKDEQPDLLPCFCAELSGTCPRHPRVKALP
jgi:hypothetical protein